MSVENFLFLIKFQKLVVSRGLSSSSLAVLQPKPPVRWALENISGNKSITFYKI